MKDNKVNKQERKWMEEPSKQTYKENLYELKNPSGIHIGTLCYK